MRPVDWAEAFKWLENGYTSGDIARIYGFRVDSFCRKAQRELDPSDHARWKKLNARNRLRPCGTTSAYQRHILKGEPTDDACREAWAAYHRAKQPEK